MSSAGEPVRVKVCGITRLEDARRALELGAWALGFIFHRPSPRSIEPGRAREIREALPESARTVGVFVDWPVSEVQEVVEQVGLHGVQLHGEETPADLEALRAPLKYRAFRVGPHFEPDEVEAFGEGPVLLDTYRQGLPGGTGETFDWSVAERLTARRPVILAGGLGVDNALEAIEAASPWAIDVSSRLESRPGEKDLELLEKLFERLTSADRLWTGS